MITDEFIEQILNLAPNPADAAAAVETLKKEQSEYKRLQDAYKEIIMGRGTAEEAPDSESIIDDNIGETLDSISEFLESED